MKLVYKGGKGSGNFGHKGRPGKEGGSASGSGNNSTAPESKPAKKVTVKRKRKNIEAKIAKFKKLRDEYKKQPWREYAVHQMDLQIAKLERELSDLND